MVSRQDKYFLNSDAIKKGYFAASQVIQDHHYKKIGLSFGGDSWEYPLWALLNNKREIQLEYFGKDYPNHGFQYSDAEVVVGDIPPMSDCFDILYDWGYLKMWRRKKD